MQLVVFGLGYTGTEIARAAVAEGARVIVTSRTPERLVAPPGVELVHFDSAGPALLAATHVLEAVLAAMRQTGPPGVRVLNLTDDEPAPNADVVTEAARLLGAPLPPLVPFETALAAMSPMGRSFWAENRRVASAKTQARLNIKWRYPSYQEGLAAVLAAEA